MALISCPKCDNLISEATPSCPHCGYQFSVVSDTINISAPSPTKVSDVQKDTSAGIFFIVLGILCIPLAIFCFLVFFIIGIVFAVWALMLIMRGYSKLIGSNEAYCPHCGKLLQFEKNDASVKCPTCKKLSVRKGEYLNPIR